LLNTLASLAAWLMGLAAAEQARNDPLTRQAKHRSRYSLIRRGFEWLRRLELPPEITQMLNVRSLRPLALATLGRGG
jgi:hypothetical protein